MCWKHFLACKINGFIIQYLIIENINDIFNVNDISNQRIECSTFYIPCHLKTEGQYFIFICQFKQSFQNFKVNRNHMAQWNEDVSDQ